MISIDPARYKFQILAIPVRNLSKMKSTAYITLFHIIITVQFRIYTDRFVMIFITSCKRYQTIILDS